MDGEQAIVGIDGTGTAIEPKPTNCMMTQILPTNPLLNLPAHAAATAATSAAFAASSAAAPPAAARLHSLRDSERAAARASKTLHFVRHAEGTHNVSPDHKTPAHLDAALTPRGVEQCLGLASATLALDVDCVVVSPMTRCLQTASLSFPHLLRNSAPSRVPFVAHEEWRETVNFLCDARRSVGDLRSDFPHVDFTNLDHDDDPIWDRFESKFGTHAEHASLRESHDADALRVRVMQAWGVIAERPERNIAVVGHSAFFMHMFTPLFAELEGLVHYEDDDVRS